MPNQEDIQFRLAKENDLSQIIQLLADDDLGRTREAISNEIASDYKVAFDEIRSDQSNELIVGVLGNEVIASSGYLYP